MIKIAFRFRSSFSFLILLTTSPVLLAQVVSPIVPVWKWGVWAATIPNATHIYDSYDQILDSWLSIHLAPDPGYYPGYFAKFEPREQIYINDSENVWNCNNCELYSHQLDFNHGNIVVEKLNPPANPRRYKYEALVGAYVISVPICPSGYSLRSDNLCVASSSSIPILEKSPKSCTTEGLIGNPVNLSIKAKYHSETDYKSGAASHLQLTRMYISGLSRRIPSIGKNWWHNYDRYIVLANQSTSQTAHVYRHDGRILLFTLQNGEWTPDSDVKDTLIQLTDAQGSLAGWEYFNATSNETEEYDATGKLMKITTPDSQFLTFSYSNSSTPTSIAPYSGLLLRLS